MKKLSLVIPTKIYYLSQGFGPENTARGLLAKYQALGLKGHNGYDLFAKHGAPLYAAHDGTITFAGEDGPNGYLVVIKTNEEFEYNGGSAYFKTLYAHMLPPIPVKAGDKVEAGDLIGYADNTGFSNGDHLHWGLKPVGKGEKDWEWYNIEQENGYNGAIDPTPYIAVKPNGNFYTASDIHSLWQKIKELQSLLAKLSK